MSRMTTFSRVMPPILAAVLAAAGGLAAGDAQLMPVGPPSPDVLITTQFRTPLAYEAAMARIDEYFDEEVGRKAAAAFPQIAPQQHFDLWHDMWVTFEAADGGSKVTIKRPADGTTARLVKGWMLSLAGRMDAPVPLEFKEEPALHSVEGDLYGSARDVARVVQTDASMKMLPTWEHAGLVVSASPLTSVTLAPAGVHGVHHVTVAAETLAAAKLLWNRIQQGVLKPGIYSAYSEEAEIEEEIHNAAQGRADTLGATESHAIYIPQMDEKLIEARLRANPDIIKRSAAAQGQYDVRFRIDKPYRKVIVKWTGLVGYSRPDGKYQGERPIGQSVIAAPKMPPQAGAHLVARTRLEPLKPGAYRVNLEGEGPTGELSKIDERTFWFDGKSFEEL
jgi:hypothetical protein